MVVNSKKPRRIVRDGVMNNWCVGLDRRHRRVWAYRPETLLSLDVHAALFSQILRHSLQMSSLERFSNIIMLYCLRFDLVDITGWYSFSDDEGSTIDKETKNLRWFLCAFSGALFEFASTFPNLARVANCRCAFMKYGVLRGQRRSEGG